MAKDISFQLDTKGGADILQRMSLPVVQRSARAIQTRAQAMAASMSSQPPEITVNTQVGTIRRGARAIATIRAEGASEHQNYIGRMALAKAKDAGRLT